MPGAAEPDEVTGEYYNMTNYRLRLVRFCTPRPHAWKMFPENTRKSTIAVFKRSRNVL